MGVLHIWILLTCHFCHYTVWLLNARLEKVFLWGPSIYFEKSPVFCLSGRHDTRATIETDGCIFCFIFGLPMNLPCLPRSPSIMSVVLQDRLGPPALQPLHACCGLDGILHLLRQCEPLRVFSACQECFELSRLLPALSIILFIAMSLHVLIPFLSFWCWEVEEVQACGQVIKFNREFDSCFLYMYLSIKYQLKVVRLMVTRKHKSCEAR